MDTIYCAWWNLENLFDTEDAARTDKLKKSIGKDLVGWTAEILDKKLSRLAEIINKMNDDKGPDIIGVAEVENKEVLMKLKNKLNRNTYAIVHADSKDERGIDVAFIYDNGLFEAKETFFHCVMRRNATRDIVQANMKYRKNNSDIVLIGNHWPSRTAGAYESEPYRIMAGETLAYFHERIYEELNDNVPVIVMGDFNDNPYNRSIIEYALSIHSKEKIKNAKETKYFYNLMWELLAKGEGTYFYSGFDLLDQFLISGNIILDKTFISIDEQSCRIIKIPAMMKDGKPIKFGKPKDKAGVNENGYSDHFPIAVTLNVK
jgi:exonuclease III